MITLRYLWGLPDGFQDSAAVVFGGDNLYTDTIDVNDYLAYSPLEVVDERTLIEAQIDAQRQAHPDFDTLYTQALADGFVFGTAVRFTLASSEPMTQTVLLDLDRQAVMYLTLQGDQAMASTFDGSTYTLQDITGGLTWDMQMGTREYWGDWSSGAATLSTQSSSDALCCLRNCLTGVVVDATIGRASKVIDTYQTAKTCYDAAKKRTVDALAECGAGLIDKVPFLGEAAGATKCAAQCAGDPHMHDCTEDKITCEQNWYNIYAWLGVSSKKVYRCSSGCYSVTPQILPCAFGQRCVAGKGCVNCGAGGVDCRQTEYRIARDPNAKYGPEGDLLPGQQVTYTITYENEGEGRAYGVFVADELSKHFDEDTLTIFGDGEYYTNTRTLSWDIGELAPNGEPGSAGAVTFTVQLTDGLPSGTLIDNQATVYFPSVPEETPTNLVVNTIQPVVALPQSLETESGQPLTITLQGKEAGGLPLTFTIAEEPLYGDLTGMAPTLVYTPMTNFVGLDIFTFKASNGITESQPAEVQIQVNPWSDDTTAPEVIRTEPEDGAVIAEVSATPILTDAVGPVYEPFIVAEFSEVISATTVTTETVQLLGGSGKPVSVTVTYNGVFNQAVIVAREPLEDNTRYTVIASQGVKDLIGNPMEADYTWGFSIGAPPTKVYLPVVLKNLSAAPGEVTIVEETFEGDFPGEWEVFDNVPGEGEYYWAKSDCRAHRGSYSGWAVGGGADGGTLSCGDNYPNNVESWMVYGPFSLADAVGAELTFQLWLNSEADYDQIGWYASTDGTNFYGHTTSGSSGEWGEKVFDLTDVPTLGNLTGESQVWIALTFSSDYSINYAEGAYVDDIVLRKSLTGAGAVGRGQRGQQPGFELRTLPRLPAGRTLGTETESSGTGLWSRLAMLNP